jgi:formylglycine-generating enzyme required for sulfatase activity
LLEEIKRPDTTDYRRAEIGDRLDRIGDPRQGMGLRPDGVPQIVWCEIPGGKVTLERDVGTFHVERFWVAKYPVTYRQYQAFLDDPEGYAGTRWWTELEHEPAPGEQYLRIGNCPADNVSWHDAMAFAAG